MQARKASKSQSMEPGGRGFELTGVCRDVYPMFSVGSRWFEEGPATAEGLFCVPKTVLPTVKLGCAYSGHEFRLLEERPGVVQLRRTR